MIKINLLFQLFNTRYKQNFTVMESFLVRLVYHAHAIKITKKSHHLKETKRLLKTYIIKPLLTNTSIDLLIDLNFYNV